MKKHITKNAMLAGFAFIALVSASIYFTNTEFSASSPQDNSARTGTAAQNNAAARSAPEKAIPEVHVVDAQGGAYLNNNIEPKKQDGAPSGKDNNLALLKKSSQTQLTEIDPAIPPPSDKNVSAESTGEYADQINQQAILAKARPEGYLPPETAPDSPPASDKNIAAEPKGEYAQEVSQQALIDKGKSDGYLSP